MSRQLRLQLPGGIYHVVARAVDGGVFFLDDTDRERWVSLLVRTASRYGWRVHAYCLMTTHVHLVVETPRPNLSRGMQYLHGCYAQRFNERWGRFGHLLAGRFGSRLIEDEEYFWEACRYVFDNPVRAGLCATPAEWRWSGGRTLRIVAPHPAHTGPSAAGSRALGHHAHHGLGQRRRVDEHRRDERNRLRLDHSGTVPRRSHASCLGESTLAIRTRRRCTTSQRAPPPATRRAEGRSIAVFPVAPLGEAPDALEPADERRAHASRPCKPHRPAGGAGIHGRRRA